MESEEYVCKRRTSKSAWIVTFRWNGEQVWTLLWQQAELFIPDTFQVIIVRQTYADNTMQSGNLLERSAFNRVVFNEDGW